MINRELYFSVFERDFEQERIKKTWKLKWSNAMVTTQTLCFHYNKSYPQLTCYCCFMQDDRTLFQFLQHFYFRELITYKPVIYKKIIHNIYNNIYNNKKIIHNNTNFVLKFRQCHTAKPTCPQRSYQS